MSYPVHRDVSPLLVPSDSNLYATVAGTGYSDAAALALSTTYYYVVRATSSSNGIADPNLIRHSATTGGACTSTLPKVLFLGATATQGQVELQWRNQAGLDTVVIHRNVKPAGQPCAFPTNPDPGEPTYVATKGPTAGNDSFVDTTVSDGVNYCYSVFTLGPGPTYSAARNVQARPFPTAGAVKWAYSTGASTMAPPGIGAAGIGHLERPRRARPAARRRRGGIWPASYIPLALGEPAQSRPPSSRAR